MTKGISSSGSPRRVGMIGVSLTQLSPTFRQTVMMQIPFISENTR